MQILLDWVSNSTKRQKLKKKESRSDKTSLPEFMCDLCDDINRAFRSNFVAIAKVPKSSRLIVHHCSGWKTWKAAIKSKSDNFSQEINDHNVFWKLSVRCQWYSRAKWNIQSRGLDLPLLLHRWISHTFRHQRIMPSENSRSIWQFKVSQDMNLQERSGPFALHQEATAIVQQERRFREQNWRCDSYSWQYSPLGF
jgi:hypothetical protein